MYAHANSAVKTLGMDKHQIRQPFAVEMPKGLSEECIVAYDVGTYPSSSLGRLRQDFEDRNVRTFDREGAAFLLHHVGFSAYICICTLNGHRCTRALGRSRVYYYSKIRCLV